MITLVERRACQFDGGRRNSAFASECTHLGFFAQGAMSQLVLQPCRKHCFLPLPMAAWILHGGEVAYLSTGAPSDNTFPALNHFCRAIAMEVDSK